MRDKWGSVIKAVLDHDMYEPVQHHIGYCIFWKCKFALWDKVDQNIHLLERYFRE